MKTLIAAALCATALATVAPALAQPYQRPAPGGVEPGHAFREQLDALDARVQQGVRAGQIDRGEADRATRELASIRGDMARMRDAGGGQLSDMDRGRLQERLDRLSQSIHWMREHGPGAGPGGPPAVVPVPGPGGDWSLERREDWLQQRIGQGRADGSLSRREAYRAQASLNDIRMSQRRMMRYGPLRDRDRAMLQERLDRLSQSLRWARNNGETMPPWRR
jgi:hypothetical protein